MIEFHNHRANPSDRRNIPHQHELARKSRPILGRDDLLPDMLAMFLDLGLTPREMSRIAGFPLAVIIVGLSQLDDADRTPEGLFRDEG